MYVKLRVFYVAPLVSCDTIHGCSRINNTIISRFSCSLEDFFLLLETTVVLASPWRHRRGGGGATYSLISRVFPPPKMCVQYYKGFRCLIMHVLLYEALLPIHIGAGCSLSVPNRHKVCSCTRIYYSSSCLHCLPRLDDVGKAIIVQQKGRYSL